MAEELSERQRDILEFIGEFQRNRKRPPAVREIGDAVGLSSPCTVYRHLDTLERRGYIKRDKGKARGIELVNDQYTQEPVRAVPIVGTIAAGAPLLAEENREGTLAIADDLLGTGDFFALRVRGDSMIDDGIQEGDIVVLRQQENAADNDIVAAFTPFDADGSATLKRFHREGERVRLQPANRNMAPIYVDAQSELRILGKAVMLTRML
ncbi:MAG: transcriptional repressor LexA [Armatimonadetes bacterium]|nr:transcriptional repressor LexA [Armatimonadota bacterium]